MFNHFGAKGRGNFFRNHNNAIGIVDFVRPGQVALLAGQIRDSDFVTHELPPSLEI
jgi:hypothetical protein